MAASNWGKETPPDGFRNRQAPPRAASVVNGRRLSVDGRAATGEAYPRLWQLVISQNGRQLSYQKQSARPIPVVSLTPLDGAAQEARMFPPPPPARKNWAVDVLTTDYLISGHLDGDRNALAFQLLGGDFSSLILTSARLTPTGAPTGAPTGTATGGDAVPDSLSAPWVVAYGDTLVAVIPRDAGSLDFAKQRNSDWKHPQPAEIHAGHYLVRGTIYSPANDVRTFAAYTTGFIVQEATITSLLPGARFAGLSAPYAMFVGRHKHFVRPLGVP